MTTDDPHEGARLPRSTKHQEELSRLGRSWFAEAGAESAREAEELKTWRKEHRKWAVFDKRPTYSGALDLPTVGDSE